MSIMELLKGLVLTIAGLGVVGLVCAAVIRFLMGTWIKARIDNSVRAEYERGLADYRHELNKQLEDYKNEMKIREQAAGVAALLAHVKWNQGKTDGEDFDRMAWEMSLWLPASLLRDVKNELVGDRDEAHFKRILLDVRKLLHGGNAGGLTADDILYFVKTQ